MKFLIAGILFILIYFIVRRKSCINKGNLLNQIMKRAVKNKGYILQKDIRSVSDPSQALRVLDRMYEKGILNIKIKDKKTRIYQFISLPSVYSPLNIDNAGQFIQYVTEIASADPDRQVFASDIAASFDVEQDDLFELIGLIEKSDSFDSFKSRDGNLYFIYKGEES